MRPGLELLENIWFARAMMFVGLLFLVLDLENARAPFISIGIIALGYMNYRKAKKKEVKLNDTGKINGKERLASVSRGKSNSVKTGTKKGSKNQKRVKA